MQMRLDYIQGSCLRLEDRRQALVPRDVKARLGWQPQDLDVVILGFSCSDIGASIVHH